jgi:multiple sugar transport system substrate-binding protein
VEVEYWSTLQTTHPEGKGRAEALKLAVAASADHVTVRYEQDGGTNSEKIIAAVSAGTPPDLLVFRPNNAAQLYDLGAAADVEAELKTLPGWPKVRETLRRSFLDGATWRGKLVALPAYRVGQAMMYAPQHLERVGAPPPAATWTWQDFEALAKRAARPPDVWGLDLAWTYSGWQNWAGSNGVRWIDKEQKRATFTQPAALEAVEFLAHLTHGLQIMPPDPMGELLIKGQTVFEQQGAYRIPTLRDAGARFKPIDMPRGPQHRAAPLKQGSLYSFIVFKSADPAKQRAAARVALGCLADEPQVTMCRIHLGLPVSRAAEQAASYRQFLAEDPDMRTFAELSPSIDVRPHFPSVEEMFKIVDAAMLRIYKRQDSVRTALAETERQVQRLLDEDHARKS